MADLVFHVCRELGGRDGVAVGEKDRVVTETVGTGRFGQKLSRPFARHGPLGAVGQGESRDTGEVGVAVLLGNVAELPEQ